MSSQQIIFFKKSRCDFSNSYVVATGSQGVGFESYIFNRNNSSAWITSGSVDADNTTLIIDLGEPKDVSDILLLKHNFKSYTIQYWNGSAYVDFSTIINPTSVTVDDSYHYFTKVNTQLIKITILGTQIVNADKFLYQFIATERIGQLAGWPIVAKPKISRNRKINSMLSGKLNVSENIGSVSFTLKCQMFSSDADLTLLETIYNYSEGFLVWLCGGSEAQFRTLRQGYRMEDTYLMKCVSDYKPEYYKGLYGSGITLDVDLEEVVN